MGFLKRIFGRDKQTEKELVPEEMTEMLREHRKAKNRETIRQARITSGQVYATLALSHGVALHHLQDSLGHSGPRTARRYDHDRLRLENHSAHAVARLFD